MTRHLRRLGLAIALAAAAGSLSTPSRAGVDPGARVRVTLLERAPADSLARFHVAPGDRLVGAYLGVRPGVLALRPDRDRRTELSVPRSLVAEFETSRGRHGRAGRGAAIGLVAGIAAGVGIGIYVERSEGPQADSFLTPGAIPVGLGIGGGVLGLGIGALVGSFFHVEDWQRSPLPPDPPPDPPPAGR